MKKLYILLLLNFSFYAMQQNSNPTERAAAIAAQIVSPHSLVTPKETAHDHGIYSETDETFIARAIANYKKYKGKGINTWHSGDKSKYIFTYVYRADTRREQYWSGLEVIDSATHKRLLEEKTINTNPTFAAISRLGNKIAFFTHGPTSGPIIRPVREVIVKTITGYTEPKTIQNNEEFPRHLEFNYQADKIAIVCDYDGDIKVEVSDC